MESGFFIWIRIRGVIFSVVIMINFVGVFRISYRGEGFFFAVRFGFVFGDGSLGVLGRDLFLLVGIIVLWYFGG